MKDFNPARPDHVELPGHECRRQASLMKRAVHVAGLSSYAISRADA
jgi:hypothetical protein